MKQRKPYPEILTSITMKNSTIKHSIRYLRLGAFMLLYFWFYNRKKHRYGVVRFEKLP